MKIKCDVCETAYDFMCVLFIPHCHICNSVFAKDKIFQNLYEREKIGDKEVLYDLALCYAYGIGVEKDEEMALNLMLVLAKQGNTDAQVYCAFSYRFGRGTTINLRKMYLWLSLATKRNNPLANYCMSQLYYDGLAVNRNVDIAFQYAVKAGNLGNCKAQYTLAQYYLNGLRFDMNKDRALYWLELSAKQDYLPALQILSKWYLHGNEYTKRDYKKAFECFFKLAELNDAEGINQLGNCYMYGTCVNVDYKKAIELFRKSASLGNSEANRSLAYCYYYGNGIKRNYREAFNHLVKSHKLNENDPDVLQYLGELYCFGIGITQNYKLGVKFLLNAALAGSPRAQYKVSLLYLEGCGDILESDYEKAIYWYKTALKNGYRENYFNVRKEIALRKLKGLKYSWVKDKEYC